MCSSERDRLTVGSPNREHRICRDAGKRRQCPLWVMCGRRLGKNFLTLLQHWSGAVMCPACLCGRVWPLALMLCADRVPIVSAHFKVR